MARQATATVLYLDHTGRLGGGEIALLHLLGALDRTLYAPLVVLASDGPLTVRLRAAGVETHVLPMARRIVEARKETLGPTSLLRLRSVFATLRYSARLAALIRRRGVVLVHTNSLKADIYGGLAGRLAGVPVIWHVRDHIDARYLPSSVAAAFRWLARRVPHAVVANSESTLRALHLPPSRPGVVVYSGVPLAPGASPDSPPVVPPCPCGPTVVLVGRLTPWKGQHVFINAAGAVLRRHPQARFRIVGAPLFGEEEYERALRLQVQREGVAGCVEFLGFRDDVPALMAAADVVVHASTLGEPFGQVVVEAMAAARPVVATDGGALPEIVTPGVTGLLVPMGDATALADAIAGLLDDPALARAMGLAGRTRVRARFRADQSARRVEALYDGLLAKGR